VPMLAVERNVPDAEVTILQLSDASAFHRRIGLVWHPDRYRSRAAQAFVETACEVAAGLAVPVLPATTC